MNMPREHQRIAQRRAQLRHVVEVHPVDPGDHGGNDGDRHPGGDAPHVLVLPDVHLREVGLEDTGEEIAEAVHLLVDPEEMVVDVAEILADLRPHHRDRLHRELIERHEQGRRGPPELQHLALEVVDPLDGVVADCC